MSLKGLKKLIKRRKKGEEKSKYQLTEAKEREI